MLFLLSLLYRILTMMMSSFPKIIVNTCCHDYYQYCNHFTVVIAVIVVIVVMVVVIVVVAIYISQYSHACLFV